MPSRAFIVAGLIRDWNKKNRDLRDVILFNVGRKQILLENIINIIPKENPVLIMDPDQCENIVNRKVAFVIIMSNIVNEVSGKF